MISRTRETAAPALTGKHVSCERGSVQKNVHVLEIRPPEICLFSRGWRSIKVHQIKFFSAAPLPL